MTMPPISLRSRNANRLFLCREKKNVVRLFEGRKMKGDEEKKNVDEDGKRDRRIIVNLPKVFKSFVTNIGFHPN